jgi:hypothetical protein
MRAPPTPLPAPPPLPALPEDEDPHAPTRPTRGASVGRTHDSGRGSLAGPPPRERPPELLVVLLSSDIVLGERNKKKERESRQASQRDASPVETEGGSHGGTATTVERSFNLPLRKALDWASKLTPLKNLTINSECPPFQFL